MDKRKIIGGLILLFGIAFCLKKYYQPRSSPIRSAVDAFIPPPTPPPPYGTAIDSLNGVKVFYNGDWRTTTGRNRAPNGYNLGIKWQCVEFVKRYYYEHFKHEMPDSYGDAIDFYEENLSDGGYSKRRNLVHFANGSKSRPVTEDIIVFGGNEANPFGHIALVHSTTADEVHIIQQNVGLYTRDTLPIVMSDDGKWYVEGNVLAWLRKKEKERK